MKIDSTVRTILKQKNNQQILKIDPASSVFDALKIMALHNIGALVVEEAGQVVGMLTERDYARKIVLKNLTSRNTRVGDVMSKEVHFVTLDDTAEGCMELMTQARIRHLPVFDNGALIGIISMGDVLKAVISDHEFWIDQLTHYITGSNVGWYDNFGPGRAAAESRILSSQ